MGEFVRSKRIVIIKGNPNVMGEIVMSGGNCNVWVGNCNFQGEIVIYVGIVMSGGIVIFGKYPNVRGGL